MKLPSPAMAVALLALFVALGGTGYAVSKLPKGSVGAKQLKRNAVTSKKIKRGAVTPSKLGRGVAERFAPGPNSIGGTQVNETSLGEVPRAARARSLDGFNPASFAPAGAIRRFSVTIGQDGNVVRTIATLGGGLRIGGRCRRFTPSDPDRDIGEAYLLWSGGTQGVTQFTPESAGDSEEPPGNSSDIGAVATRSTGSNPTGITQNIIHHDVVVGNDGVEVTMFGASTTAGTTVDGTVAVALNEDTNATCKFSGVVTVG